jgi:hypothetical protein
MVTEVYQYEDIGKGIFLINFSSLILCIKQKLNFSTKRDANTVQD